ncbi:hypothetical protein LCGC14_1453790, partial [marine sediment metagenome]
LLDHEHATEETLKMYKEDALCLDCRSDMSKMDAVDLTKEDQLDFKLSSKSPIPIDVPGATNMGWLVLNHPKVFIGSHITCENYGLTVKFTIIPPTREAGERIVNTMRTDREKRNRKLRPGHKGNAPSRYTL